MEYAPITSVDVVSLFFTYKNILSDNKISLTTENLEKFMVVNSFFKFKLIFQIFYSSL